MLPIAPPPRFPRSRKHKKQDTSNVTRGVTMSSSSPVKSWLPFGCDLRSPSSDSIEDTFFNALDSEVAFATSCSEDADDSTGGVEMQLRSTIGNYNRPSPWHLKDDSADEQSLSELAPIPFPGTANDQTDRSMRLTHSESTESISNAAFARNQKAPQSNQKIVKRRGLGRNNSQSDDDKTLRGRGRSVSTQRTTRSRSAIRTKPARSFSLIRNAPKNIVPGRSRSIIRFRGSRSDSSGEDKSASEKSRDSENGGMANRSMDRSREIRGTVQPSASIPMHSRNAAEVPFDDNASVLEHPFPTTPIANGAPESELVLPRVIRTRDLLETSVYHNEATGIWITTINMSQKETVVKSNAAKYLKAFSFQTEHEARESAYANAPAKMMPFDEHPFCFLCSTQFSVFKRAAHCRNCGVCICSNCSVGWNKMCIPETYNIKAEASIKVCNSCGSLSKLFRRALLDANYEDALRVYNTGNVNLRCPFTTNKGGESMLPVHCAAEGGSLDLLEWLVEVHYCPLKRIRTGNRNKTQHADELITTSKGKSVVEIAMANKSVESLRYLVCEKSIGFDGIRDLNVALNALEAVLKSPYMNHSNDVDDNPMTPIQRANSMAPPTPELTRIGNGLPTFAISGIDEFSDSDDSSPINVGFGIDSDDDESVATTVHDACIICYANSIDCVITPCGHQICCLQCSKNMKSCPVCNVSCKFIRIFRP